MYGKKQGEALDVEWKPASDDELSCINFRRNKKYHRLKLLLKAVAFVVVACISGGITAAYIVDKKYPHDGFTLNNPKNKSLFDQKSTDTVYSYCAESRASQVVSIIGPAIVGISNKISKDNGDVTVSHGSGIIISKDGYIVTSYHVIEGTDNVVVKLSSGKILNGALMGFDNSMDIAVIKVTSSDLPVAKFGDASKVRVGQNTIAIGNQYGEEYAGTVTSGVISTTGRKVKVTNESGKEVSYKMFLTDAGINSGNSGGALCNDSGEVIGINSLKFSMNQESEEMGAAISIDDAKKIIDKIMNKGNEKSPTIGASILDVVSEKNSSIKGVYVSGVEQNSPAYKAKIQNTDIIVAVDNHKINNKEDYFKCIRTHKIGDTVLLKVWRKGKTFDANVVLVIDK